MRILFLAVVLAPLGVAATVATFVGPNSPVPQGFTVETAGSGVSAASSVADDGGFPAWRFSGVYNWAYYYRNFTANEQAAAGNGWKLTARLRIGSTNLNDGAGVSLSLGGRRWDATLRNVNGGTQISANPFATGNAVVIAGPAARYVLLEWIYKPQTRTADLYVNGEKRLTDFPGHSSFAAGNGFSMGAGAGFGESGICLVHFVRVETGAGLESLAPTATVSAASYAAGGVAPGEIVTVGGWNLGPAQVSTAAVSNGRFPTLVAGTRFLFDEQPAPVIYVSDKQSSVIVPYAMAGKSTAQLVLERNGNRSAPLPLAVLTAKPALFSANASGTGPGAILNQDFTLNTAENPAPRGSYIILYGTGEGQTIPPGVDGALSTAPYPRPVQPLGVRFGSITASEIPYAGAAPGLVLGLFQINVRVPADAPSGAVPVTVTSGSAVSQTGITVAVQ